MSEYNSPPTVHIPQLENLKELNRLDHFEKLLNEIREQRAGLLQDYISKKDFLQLFGIKEGMLYKLINEGKLKDYRINRKIYLKQSEVNEALQKGLLK